jgi:hypothetical protein
MSAILTDPAVAKIILIAIGFIGAAWAAGHVATNDGEVR